MYLKVRVPCPPLVRPLVQQGQGEPVQLHVQAVDLLDPLQHLTTQICKQRHGVSTLGYNEFDFLKKIKNTDPLMGAKLKSKTHLLNMFFDFLRRFFGRLASKFEKVGKVLLRYRV
jgi:hypothetical protein